MDLKMNWSNFYQFPRVLGNGSGFDPQDLLAKYIDGCTVRILSADGVRGMVVYNDNGLGGVPSGACLSTTNLNKSTPITNYDLTFGSPSYILPGSDMFELKLLPKDKSYNVDRVNFYIQSSKNRAFLTHDKTNNMLCATGSVSSNTPTTSGGASTMAPGINDWGIVYTFDTKNFEYIENSFRATKKANNFAFGLGWHVYQVPAQYSENGNLKTQNLGLVSCDERNLYTNCNTNDNLWCIFQMITPGPFAQTYLAIQSSGDPVYNAVNCCVRQTAANKTFSSVCDSLQLTRAEQSTGCVVPALMYCAKQPLDANCISYCQNRGVNCDLIYDTYAESLYEGGKDTINIHALGCFQPSDIMQNYYNSLVSNGLRQLITPPTGSRVAGCVFEPCLNSSLQRYGFIKSQDCVAQDLKICLANITITNSGLIGNINASIKQECGVSANTDTTTTTNTTTSTSASINYLTSMREADKDIEKDKNTLDKIDTIAQNEDTNDNLILWILIVVTFLVGLGLLYSGYHMLSSSFVPKPATSTTSSINSNTNNQQH
jgi:hypothetical protein